MFHRLVLRLAVLSTCALGATWSQAANMKDFVPPLRPVTTLSYIDNQTHQGVSVRAVLEGFAFAPPDRSHLTLSSAAESFSLLADSATDIAITVRNDGTLPTDTAPEILWPDAKQLGLQIRPTSIPNTWKCEASTLHCTRSEPLLPGKDEAETLTFAVDGHAVRHDVTPQIQVLDHHAVQASLAPHFVWHDRATLSGHVWVDLDGNGVIDAGEPALAGWHMQLLEGQQVVAEAVSNDKGEYEIADLKSNHRYVLVAHSASEALQAVPEDGEHGHPVTHATVDNEVEGLVYASFEPGKNYVEQGVPVRPVGVVYDADTHQVVAGAQVQLVGPPGFDPAKHLAGKSNGTALTDENGRYYFLFKASAPAGEYALRVQAPDHVAGFAPLVPPQSQPLNLDSKTGIVPASNTVSPPQENQRAVYYSRFTRAAGSTAQLMQNHLPVSRTNGAEYALALEKTAASKEVEAADVLRYSLALLNVKAPDLDGFEIADELPPGFGYLPGSARIKGDASRCNVRPEPIASGRYLRFVMKPCHLGSQGRIEITYLARVGITMRDREASVSRARATSGAYSSNQASVTVNVNKGVFATDGFIVGKVYVDRNGNGQQDPGEPGVPGVRIYMENGSYVLTDEDGKYSFYGVRPLTHVLKVDATSLPAETAVAVTSNRQAEYGPTMFVDVRNAEMRTADFALNATRDLSAEIASRRQAAMGATDELAAVIAGRLVEASSSSSVSSSTRNTTAAGVISAPGHATRLPEASSSKAPSKDNANALPSGHTNP